MPDSLRDGTGRGYLASVTANNALQVWATTESAERHENEHGYAYHLLFAYTPTGAGDCFLYIKNSSDDYLIVMGISFRVASAEQILVKLGDSGTPTGGATLTPVNCNAGSAKMAIGTFQGAVDITSLSGGSTVEKYWLSNTASSHFNFEQVIVLPTNGVMTLYAVTGGIAVAGTVVFNYHHEERH